MNPHSTDDSSEMLPSETLPHALVRASRSVRYAATAALVLLALFLLAETVSAAQSVFTFTNPNTDTISVSGEGTATAVPDTATISFTVLETAADAATAQANVTAKINDALASVKSAGVSSDDVTTDNFSVAPHYTDAACQPGIMCTNTNPSITGYDVSEDVTVNITDISKVSMVLDGLTKAGVSNVSGPNLIVGDPQAVEAKARAQAIQNAQTDAQALAAQLHMHLGKMIDFEDTTDSGDAPQPMTATADTSMSASGVSAPTIPVGQNTYTKDVTLTYQVY
jgi:uncharacterized protein YggE